MTPALARPAAAASTASIHKLAASATVSRERERAAVAAIEAERDRRGLSHAALCAAAGVTESHWRRLRLGSRHASPRTLRQLMRAVTGAHGLPAMPDGPAARLAFEGLQERAARCAGADGLVDGASPRDIAIYAAHCALGWPQARIAGLVGLTGQRVQVIVARIEDQREGGTTLAALLARLEEAFA